MNIGELDHLFEKHNEQYLKFDLVEAKRSKRPDVHAFIVLDELMPPEGIQDLIGSATHDEFYLSLDVKKFAEVATEPLIIDLIRCGVRFDSYNDALCFFA